MCLEQYLDMILVMIPLAQSHIVIKLYGLKYFFKPTTYIVIDDIPTVFHHKD